MSCTCARCVFTTHERVETMLAIRGHFVMSHEEAEEKEIIQIGKSACGATAVLNALVSRRSNALGNSLECLVILLTERFKMEQPTFERRSRSSSWHTTKKTQVTSTRLPALQVRRGSYSRRSPKRNGDLNIG